MWPWRPMVCGRMGEGIETPLNILPHPPDASFIPALFMEGEVQPPTVHVLGGSRSSFPPCFPAQVWRMKAGSTPGPSSTLSGAKPHPWESRAAPGRCEVRDGGAQRGFPPATPRGSHLTPKPSSFCHLDQLHDVVSAALCTHQIRPRECVCAPRLPRVPVTPLQP